jgi:hypothetical protein
MRLPLTSVNQSSAWKKAKKGFNDQELCGFPVRTAMRVLLRCLNLKRYVGFLDMAEANNLHRFSSIRAFASCFRLHCISA